jgi:hypothetical protein
MVIGAQIGSVLGGIVTVACGPLAMLAGLVAGMVAGAGAGDKVGEVCDDWICSDCRGPYDGNFACS